VGERERRPRVLAETVVAPLLSSLVILVGICGGFFFSVFFQDVSPGAFVGSLTFIPGISKVIVAWIKAALFGLAAGLIACYKGISVSGGPAGVGSAKRLWRRLVRTLACVILPAAGLLLGGAAGYLSLVSCARNSLSRPLVRASDSYMAISALQWWAAQWTD
jgi:ABC-type transporter Mla maintaining outer membrane lipid asymmetry permease subunit MlaE